MDCPCLAPVKRVRTYESAHGEFVARLQAEYTEIRNRIDSAVAAVPPDFAASAWTAKPSLTLVRFFFAECCLVAYPDRWAMPLRTSTLRIGAYGTRLIDREASP